MKNPQETENQGTQFQYYFQTMQNLPIGADLTIDFFNKISFKGIARIPDNLLGVRYKRDWATEIPGKLPIRYNGYWRTSALNVFYDEVGKYLTKH